MSKPKTGNLLFLFLIIALLATACGKRRAAHESPLSLLSPVSPIKRTIHTPMVQPQASPTATLMPSPTQTPTKAPTLSPTITPYRSPTPFPTFEPVKAFHIEAMDSIDGFSLIRLDAPLGVRTGAWSPDGRRLVVYIPLESPSERTEMTGPMVAVFVYNPASGGFWDTGARERLIFQIVSWLPDNRLVHIVDGNVWVAEADGSNRHILAMCDGVKCDEISLSPDGERILVMSQEGFHLVDVVMENSQQVRGLDQGRGNWSWSNSGARIALIQSGWRYFLIDVASGSATFLAEVPGLGRGGRINPPAWVADERLLLAGEQMPGPNYTVVAYVIDPATGKVTSVPELLDLSDTSFQLMVSPVVNRQYLAALAYPKSPSTPWGYFYDFETGGVEQVPNVEGAWSPTRPILAFIDDTKTLRLWQLGGNIADLASGAVPGASVWSPDGKQLAYVAGGAIWVFAPGSDDAPIQISPRHLMGDRPWQLYWSPSGEYIAYALDQAIWIVAADGISPAVQVTSVFGQVWGLSWSSNSDFLVVQIPFEQPNQSPLYLIDLNRNNRE